MSGPPDDIETRLRRLPRHQLPGGLKRRVIAEASLAPRAPWGDRAWYSTRWRLAAAAALVALAAADWWSARIPTAGPAGPPPAAAEESVQVAAVGVEMGMPAAAMARLTSRVEFAGLTAQESREQAGAALR